jgi:phenylpropionate dioxygenase-like ring-hydroxylating dioxygenase large terminal subunit
MALSTARTTARGAALDAANYLDPDFLGREQERIFERTWQLAGHVSALPRTGSYATSWAGDQPVLAIRDDDGAVRAFRNVCRHRGSRLLSGSGQCKKAIRCRYHGWTYRLDGSLIGVPEARTYDDLDKSKLGLFPVRTEVVAGLIFVNLDPHAQPLAPRLGDLPERLARYDVANLEPFAPWEGEQPVNWKIVVDNYLEGYHVPIAHPGLMRLLDYGRYDVELHEDWVWFEAPLRDKRSGNRIERAYQRIVRPMPGLEPEDKDVWRYILIYPNTAIDLYPDQVTTWQIRPVAPDRTHDSFQAYRSPSCGPRTRIAQRLNQRLNMLVHREDVDLVENVQAGLRTRGYSPGPLSAREAAVGWFADRIRTDLA